MFRSIDISNISALGSKLSLVTLTETLSDGSVLSVTSGSFNPAINIPNIPNYLNQADTTSHIPANFLNNQSRSANLHRATLNQPSTSSVISSALLSLLTPCDMRLRSGLVCGLKFRLVYIFNIKKKLLHRGKSLTENIVLRFYCFLERFIIDFFRDHYSQ